MAWLVPCKVLLVYSHAARIPVAVVQFLAMGGHWSTHYFAMNRGGDRIE